MSAASVSVDFYAVLHVSRGATLQEINAAYKKLALKYHPDKCGDIHVEQFRMITQAAEVLRDPERRLEHDVLIGNIRNAQQSRYRAPAFTREENRGRQWSTRCAWRNPDLNEHLRTADDCYVYSYGSSVHMDPYSEESMAESARGSAEAAKWQAEYTAMNAEYEADLRRENTAVDVDEEEIAEANRKWSEMDPDNFNETDQEDEFYRTADSSYYGNPYVSSSYFTCYDGPGPNPKLKSKPGLTAHHTPHPTTNPMTNPTTNFTTIPTTHPTMHTPTNTPTNHTEHPKTKKPKLFDDRNLPRTSSLKSPKRQYRVAAQQLVSADGPLRPFCPYFNDKLTDGSEKYNMEDMITEINGIFSVIYFEWLLGLNQDPKDGGVPLIDLEEDGTCSHMYEWTKEFDVPECDICHFWRPILVMTCPNCFIKRCIYCRF